MPRSRAGCWVASSILFLSGGALALFGLVWAAFFSVGARGGTTADMIRYNLRDPVLAAVAYGPLALGALMLLGALAGAVLTPFFRRRSDTDVEL